MASHENKSLTIHESNYNKKFQYSLALPLCENNEKLKYIAKEVSDDCTNGCNQNFCKFLSVACSLKSLSILI